MSHKQYIEAGVAGAASLLITFTLMAIVMFSVFDSTVNRAELMLLIIGLGIINGIITVKWYLWFNQPPKPRRSK